MRRTIKEQNIASQNSGCLAGIYFNNDRSKSKSLKVFERRDVEVFNQSGEIKIASFLLMTDDDNTIIYVPLKGHSVYGQDGKIKYNSWSWKSSYPECLNRLTVTKVESKDRIEKEKRGGGKCSKSEMNDIVKAINRKDNISLSLNQDGTWSVKTKGIFCQTKIRSHEIFVDTTPLN